MSLLTQVSIPDAFIIFFLTLGPLKAIGPFAQATRGADPALLRTLAWRSTSIATVIVLVVALLGAVLMRQWRVSVAAPTMAGGLIFLLLAIQMILAPPSPPPPTDAQLQPPSPALAHFPLAIPALVTAPGIMAIVAFMAIACSDWTQQGIVIALLLLIMALNLLALLNVRLIFQYVPPTILLVLGWVMPCCKLPWPCNTSSMVWCGLGCSAPEPLREGSYYA
jgi:multiple antibiotic resistance protein